MQNILRAREAFEFLETKQYSSVADDHLATIRQCLAKENVDASILDRSGTSSAAQMEERLAIAMENNYIECARQTFNGLESGRFAEIAVNALMVMDKAVSKMKADISVLDRSGKSTNEQIRKRIVAAWDQNMLLNRRLMTLPETRQMLAESAAKAYGAASAAAAPQTAAVAAKPKAVAPVVAQVATQTGSGTLPLNTGAVCSRPRASRSKQTERHLLDLLKRRTVKKIYTPA